MKHSASGSMTEYYEAKVVIPCEGSYESVLQKLYIDLCNLIVESRIPGLNDRGYGDGVHCPPLLGSSTHICDLSKPECQKHQKLIHHLLRAVGSNIFEIEVLMLPGCCSESKLKERIHNKEYVLVERWSMNHIFGKVQSNIEVSQLLRAVRSFLHFSQISAWLSSSKGKSPANIYYWVKPSLDAVSTKFEHEPEVHSFPIFKIHEDLYGSVKVEYPARIEYVPIIPCSKHPPLCAYALRAINDESSLCQNIPLNPQLVRQLHKTTENEQNKLTSKNFVSEPAALLTSVSLLKTFTGTVLDGSKTNRVLKHSNSQDSLINTSSLSLDLKSKNIDVISKKPSTYVCNYAETYALGLSQENLSDKRHIARHLRKTELKIRKLKKDSFHTLTYENPSPIVSSPALHNFNKTAVKYSFLFSDLPGNSNSQTNISNNENALLTSSETSQAKEIVYQHPTSQNLHRELKQNKKNKAFKRKKIDTEIDAEKMCMCPQKKMCCDINLSPQLFKNSSIPVKCAISLPQSSKTSQTKGEINSLQNITKDFVQENNSTLASSDSYISDKIKMTELNSFLHKKDNYHSKCSSLSFKTGSKDTKLFKQAKICVYNTNSQNAAKTLKRVVLGKIARNKVNNCVSRCNSEIKLCKRTCVSQFDGETIRKEKKFTNECNMFLNLNAETSSHKNTMLNCNNGPQNTIINPNVPEKNSLGINLSDTLEIRRKVSFLRKTNSKCRNLNTSGKDDRHHPKHVPMTNASNKEIQNLDPSCKMEVCMQSHLLYQRKTIHYSFNNLKFSSLKLRPTFSPEKSCLVQKSKSGRRSNRLFLKSNQIITKKHISEETDSNFETNIANFNTGTSISLCSSSSKTCLPKICLKQVSGKSRNRTTCATFNPSDERHILKSKMKERVMEKTFKPSLTKESRLNKLFRVRKKANRSNDVCGKDSDKNSKERLFQSINSAKSASSQAFSEKIVTSLSFNDSQNNLIIPKTISRKDIKSLCVSANQLEKRLQRTSLSEETSSGGSNDSNSQTYQYEAMPKSKMISLLNESQSSFVLNTRVPTASRYSYQALNENLECFPKHASKFPKGKKLLVNFEESILKGCLPMVKNVKGFHAEIGASGSFCPNHLTLPADVSFYELGNPHQGTAPYVAHVNLGDSEYFLPKKGAVQVTLFNPSETVVKMFVLNYDLSNMPPLCHTFIRQKIYYLPVGSTEEYPSSLKWLRFIVHLRFASSKTGRIFLHEDFKIVILNKSNDDAASEFSQEPRELRSFLSVPMNPTFSSI